MSFFYFTTLGAVYFYTLTAICAFAIYRGGWEPRLMAFCVAGVFLADRTLLATMTNEAWMIGLGAVAEFVALFIILEFAAVTAISRCIGFLFLAKMMAYVCLLGGFISFGTMAAWTELAGYLQLLIIGGGAINDARGKHSRDSGDIRHGAFGILHTRKSWLSSKRRAGSPD